MITSGRAKARSHWLARWFHRCREKATVAGIRMPVLEMLPSDSKVVEISLDPHPPLDCWTHHTVALSHADGNTESLACVLLEDEMIRDAYTPGVNMCPKRFLAVHDIIQRRNNANEAACETVFSQLIAVVGNNRPFKEGGVNSTFESRAMLLVNSPSVFEAEPLVQATADAWVRGLPQVNVEAMPLPVFTHKKHAKDEAGAGMSLHPLSKPLQFKDLHKKSASMFKKHTEYLKSECCEVDLDCDAWKQARYPMPDNAEEIAQSFESENYEDPQFDFRTEGSFRETRTRRTIYVPGMCARSGSDLASQRS